MDLVDLPKEEVGGTLGAFQKENLFESIVRGKDVVETIRTSRGAFKIKFPRAKDLELIARLTAYRLRGISVQSFDDASYTLIRQLSTLDVVVLDGPAWYENAKKEKKEKNEDFSWGEVPSQKFIREVYAKALEFHIRVQEVIEGEPKEEDTGLAPVTGTENIDGAGVFEGLSGST